MANRIALYDLDSINNLISQIELVMPAEWFAERHNIAPLSAVWIVHLDIVTPRLTPAVWGLIPPWAKPGQFSRPLTHARAETIWEKASFKSLIRRYRGIVLCNGFYVFRGRGADLRTYYVSSPDNAVALGVVWQYNSDGNTEVAIINTDVGDLAKSIQARVPVVIDRENVDEWLNSDKSNMINSLMGLSSAPANGSNTNNDLRVIEVSTFVREPTNEGPQCIQPVDSIRH